MTGDAASTELLPVPPPLDMSSAAHAHQTGLVNLSVHSIFAAPSATEQKDSLQLQSLNSHGVVKQPGTASEPADLLIVQSQEHPQADAEQEVGVGLQSADNEGQVHQASADLELPVHVQAAQRQEQVKQPKTEMEDPLQLQTAAIAGLVKQEGLQAPSARQKASTVELVSLAAPGQPKVELTGGAATAMALVQAGKRRPRSSKLSIDHGTLLPRYSSPPVIFRTTGGLPFLLQCPGSAFLLRLKKPAQICYEPCEIRTSSVHTGVTCLKPP